MTSSEINQKYLKIVLYFLLGEKELSSKLENHLVNCFYNDYDPQEQKGIYLSLKWALANPDFDFQNLLPDIVMSNDQLIESFKKIFAKISE